MPRTLKFEKTMIIANYECKQRMSTIYMMNSLYDYNVCTLSENNLGTCNADAGSPLMNSRTMELIGLSSWGKSCALGYPDVFTGVYQHLPWLQELMASHVEMESEKYVKHEEQKEEEK